MIALSLKLTCLTLTMLCSLAGFVPVGVVMLKDLSQHSAFIYAKSFSAGVILGVALLHLLDDALDVLSARFPNYPVALALMSGGFLVTLGLHLLSVHLGANNHEKHGLLHARCLHHHGPVNGKIQLSAPDARSKLTETTPPKYTADDVDISVDGPKKSLNSTAARRIGSNDGNNKWRAVILEGSISLHSIIIGYDYGLQTDEYGMTVLMLALCVHQFFEGISLGTLLVGYGLRFRFVVVSALLFASSLPAGIVMGIATHTQSATHDVIAAALNAFAAGMLLFTATVEMVGHDFFGSHLDGKPRMAFLMFAFLSLGCVCMAILAYWA